MNWAPILAIGSAIGSLVFTVIFLSVIIQNAIREKRRRKRFPKRMFIDGELAYQIDYEGVCTAAPRWELRIERDLSITALRKP